MKNANTAYVTVGRVGSPYGVRGWLKVQPYTESDTSLLEYSPWYIAKQDSWEILAIEDKKTHGNGIIIKLTGIESPEEARLLTGKLIAVLRSQLPHLKKDEYYWSDLEGLTVINKHGDILGTVIYLMETGANDVLVVKGTKEHAIPYLPGSVILSVDLIKKEIHVDWELI